MKKYDLIIVVSNEGSYPYKQLCNAIKKTWIKNNLVENIKVIFYTGGFEEISFDGENLYLDSPNDFQNQGVKTLAAYQWILKNFEFDFIYGVTASSYLNIQNLITLVKTIDKDDFIYGSLFNLYPPVRDSSTKNIIEFGSGASILWSKSAINFLISKKLELDIKLPNDVAYGKILLSKYKKPKMEIRRQDFYNYFFSNKINLDEFHFRFNISYEHYPRFLEILLMYKLNLIFYHKKLNILLKILGYEYILFLLFNFCKFFNPTFLKIIIKKISYNTKKFLVKLIKSNFIFYTLAKKIKKILKN